MLTLYRWILRFNREGIDGIADRPRAGRPHKVPRDKVAELKEVLTNPEKAGELFWTAKKFHGYLNRESKETVSYSTTLRFLHDENFALKVPRRWPAKQDEQLRAEFIELITNLMQDPDTELWFLDESGIEGDPKPRRRWAQKGSKQTIPYAGDHIRVNVCGMVAPRHGEFFALEVDYMDKDAFQVFLDEANKSICHQRTKPIIVLDNASWHKAKGLEWGKFTPCYLPPYSPDLNPIERLWLYIKSSLMPNFYTRDYNLLIEHVSDILRQVINDTEINQSVCNINYVKTS